METLVDIFTMLVVIAAPFFTLYIVANAVRSWWSRRNAPDPYAEFDRWQRFFNAGIEARNCGLDPEDNPGIDPCDYDAWLDGWKASDSLRRLQKAARGREVA